MAYNSFEPMGQKQRRWQTKPPPMPYGTIALRDGVTTRMPPREEKGVPEHDRERQRKRARERERERQKEKEIDVYIYIERERDRTKSNEGGASRAGEMWALTILLVIMRQVCETCAVASVDKQACQRPSLASFLSRLLVIAGGLSLQTFHRL